MPAYWAQGCTWRQTCLAVRKPPYRKQPKPVSGQQQHPQGCQRSGTAAHRVCSRAWLSSQRSATTRGSSGELRQPATRSGLEPREPQSARPPRGAGLLGSGGASLRLPLRPGGDGRECGKGGEPCQVPRSLTGRGDERGRYCPDNARGRLRPHRRGFSGGLRLRPGPFSHPETSQGWQGQAPTDGASSAGRGFCWEDTGRRGARHRGGRTVTAIPGADRVSATLPPAARGGKPRGGETVSSTARCISRTYVPCKVVGGSPARPLRIATPATVLSAARTATSISPRRRKLFGPVCFGSHATRLT